MRSVLLQLHCGRPVKCESWLNAPVTHGVQITVYVQNAGGGPEKLARRTHAALERELVNVGATRGPAPCGPHAFAAHTCAGAVSGIAGRVLIFIADGSARIDPIMEAYFSHPGTVVLPIVDESLAPPPSVLPPFMRTTLAESTSIFDPGPVIPRLIRGAGIGASSVRLFISYRHSEAAAVAGPLFHALAARGFEPFLDRFSSRPGDDFVDLIREELADKSCLLSLETTGIGHSLYCRQEVATAVARRMGLIAIDLPTSRQIFKVIRRRIDMSKAATQPGGGLSKSDIDNIVGQIETIYPHEAVRRSRWQDSNLDHAISGAGLRASAQGLARYVARGAKGDYLLAMSAGFPRTGHFIELEESCRHIHALKAVIFGPLAAARSNRHRDIGWLSQKSNVNAVDEGRLFRYVKRLK